jgi:hypothetical protein
MIWEDATSYSQKGPRVQHWWRTKLGSLRLSVGNDHIYYRDGKTWLLTCSPWFDVHPLKATNEQDAKVEAFDLVRAKCQEIIDALELV